MKRLLAILVLGFLALGSVGLSATSAGAGAADCAASAATALDDIAALAIPAAQIEGPAAKHRLAPPADGPRLACNSACARSCRQQFGNCPTRQCRQQFNACVRGCGC